MRSTFDKSRPRRERNAVERRERPREGIHLPRSVAQVLLRLAELAELEPKEKRAVSVLRRRLQ